METAVFFSNEKMQLIKGTEKGGRLKIESLLNVEFGQGAVINGVITNDQMVQAAASKLRNWGVKKARLVIDSGLILVKYAEVPRLSPKQMVDFTKNELSDFGSNYEDLIYDYAVLGPAPSGQGSAVLCCGAERKLIASYSELFKSAGVKLTSVDFSVNAACKLTAVLPELDKKTYILSVLDGNNLVSMLFEENRYVLSNRFRLFAERNTGALGDELAEKVSSMIQFNRARRSPHEIRNAYFCGMRQDELPICGQISARFGIEASILPDSQAVTAANQTTDVFHLSDFLFAAGCLIRK